MKDLELARRALLKKLGVGLACLPLLRARRARAQSAAPRRLMLIQMSLGYRQQYWRPAIGSLADHTLPPTLTSFEPVKAQLTVLPDLTNPGAAGRGAYGVMFYGLGVTGTTMYREPTGKTLDQVVASGLPLAPGGRRSLHLAAQIDRAPRASTAPGGSRCFWSGAGQPIDPIADPAAVYQELFSGTANPDPQARRLLARRKSILDYVGSSLEDFGKRAGTEERQVIQAHLQSIRDIETQVQAVETAHCGLQPIPSVDLDAGANYPVILRAHLRLMVAALKCGVTYVTTLQTTDAAGKNLDCGFIPGIPTSNPNSYKTPFYTWADLGHNPLTGGVDHKRIADAWFLSQFAETVQELRSVQESGGTLLDNTIVVIANDVQDGSNHDAQRAPWMLAGNCGGYLATGQCLPSTGKPIASVMAGICEAMKVSPHPYGPVMDGLKA
jgi:hypothetical protein